MIKKNIKYSNSIIIGGPIAVGKSTIVNELAKLKKWNQINEFEKGDHLNNIILEKLYQGKRIEPATMQTYFLLKRFYNYKKNANSKIISIFDRGIWEDWLFAKHLMAKQDPESYNHYKKLWNQIIKKMLKEIGKPKAYIYLSINWTQFKIRIFNRGRESEILNFDKNKIYFKKLLKDYNDNFLKLLKTWNLNIIHINTNNISKKEVFQILLKKLKKINIQ